MPAAKIIVKRDFSVSDTVLGLLQKRYQDVTFVLEGHGAHDHPIGALERAVSEEKLYRWAEYDFKDYHLAICDIGGNANRHAAAGRMNVHSCNPVLDGSDVIRRLPETYAKGANYCGDRSLDCVAPVPDVYMAVHSLYYLTPDEVLEHVYRSNAKRLYAVVHEFRQLYGHFHGADGDYESKFECYPKGDSVWVSMTVRGNSVPYTHDACFWLAAGYYESRGRAMAWTGKRVGDSWMYKFAPAPNGLTKGHVKTMGLVESLSQAHHYGEVEGLLGYGDQDNFRPVLEFLNIATCKISSVCGVSIIRDTGGKQVLIPKDLVHTVANKFIGYNRDRNLLKAVIAEFRSQVRKMNLPPAVATDTIVYGSALAFIVSIDGEIAAFSALLQPRWMRAYENLRRVMELDLEVFVCCAKSAGPNLTVETYNETRASVPSAMFDAKIGWPKGLPGVECNRPLVPRRAGSQIKFASRDKIEDKPQFYPNAITFSNYIPLVPYASANNEVVSVNNRALMKVPEPFELVIGNVGVAVVSEEGVTTAMSFLMKAIERWLPKFTNNQIITPEVVDAKFQVWNSRFPMAKAKQQALTYQRIRERGYLVDSDLVFDGFVKRELTLKGGPDPQDFDPRWIQSPTAAANVVTGPFFFQFSKRLQEEWHPHANITYAAGMTAEELGAWRGQFGDEDVIIIELDETRYDAHMGKRSYDTKMSFYETFGIDEWPLAKEAYVGQKTKRGFSPKGVRWKVKYTVGSGQPDTSCGNSLWNGLKVEAFLDSQGVLLKAKVLVMGDDSLIVLRLSGLSEETKTSMLSDVNQFNRSLGFSVKAKISTEWHEVEFCSSLFWPVEGGYVLGPKPGRMLPKMGWGLKELTEPQVKGMLLGMKMQCGFVPVLRKYVKYCLDLLGKAKTEIYNDARSIYKSFAVEHHSATSDTELFFFKRYGQTVKDMETSFIEAIRGAKRTSCVDWRDISHLLDVDL